MQSIAFYHSWFLLGNKILLSEESDLGRCPKNPQGTSPLTQYRLCPNPSSPEGRKRRNCPLFCWRGYSVSLMSIDFRGISSQTAVPPAPIFHGSIDNNSAPIQQFRFLHVQDGLLTKEDKQLPLARHVVSTLEHFHFVKTLYLLCLCGRRKL